MHQNIKQHNCFQQWYNIFIMTITSWLTKIIQASWPFVFIDYQWIVDLTLSISGSGAGLCLLVLLGLTRLCVQLLYHGRADFLQASFIYTGLFAHPIRCQSVCSQALRTQVSITASITALRGQKPQIWLWGLTMIYLKVILRIRNQNVENITDNNSLKKVFLTKYLQKAIIH